MDSLDVYLSKKKDRSTKKIARNVAKERFEKAREITREHRAAMDRLSKKVTPAPAADKPVRRSPRNNAENNPPPQVRRLICRDRIVQGWANEWSLGLEIFCLV